MHKHLVLIDGSGFIFRAYHALPPLSNPQGVPVGAVYGYVTMLLKLLDRIRDQASQENHQHAVVAVVFDAARQTFRNRIYQEYKAHRPPAPEDLVPQFALIREATDAMRIPRIEREDVEADDIIATYALQAQREGWEVMIVSSDKDLMQLISPGIQLWDPMKQKNIGEAEVREKFGVAPPQVLDVLSLIGDSSDNVPGVPGIGPKTAAELIGQFGTLEALLENARSIKQPKRRESLEQHADKARLSKALIRLKSDVELPDFKSMPLPVPDRASLLDFLSAQGFKSLLVKLGGTPAAAPPPSTSAPVISASSPETVTLPASVERHTVRTAKELAQWITKAHRAGRVAFDTETTGLNALQAELVGFSLCIDAGNACYVPLTHTTRSAVQTGLFDESTADSAALAPGQIPLAEALQLLKPLLEDPYTLKIGHNIKYDMLIMKQHGIAIAPYEDTMLISYVLGAGLHGHGLDELAERHLHHQTIRYDSVTGTGKSRISFREVEIEKACAYAAEDADITLRLHQHLKPQLHRSAQTALYETIERPLVKTLLDMEIRGIKVDVSQLSALSDTFLTRMQSLEYEIHQLAGTPFNIASPKQLGEILFERMGLPGGKKSAKTGAYTTDNEVLEQLASAGHALPARAIEWRQLAKLKSTYSDALAHQINPRTRRVHTSYAMAITSTGRLSSSDPNLQNIPIRTPEGKRIRQTFVAEAGYVLLSADYSQIELRLLAHMADIPTLKQAFSEGKDIHAITASQMFGLPVEQVDSELRRRAKTINFGIIYGISAHGLAARLGIGRSEAAAYIERYFSQYPGIQTYMERCKQQARANGFVTTLYGRRCHLPGIHDKNAAVRQFSERAAINAPLQGTAADIIKRAMLSMPRALSPLGNRVHLLLQVHDELVFEVPEDLKEAAAHTIRAAMENAAELSVPLTVETGYGQHWGEAH